VIINIDGLERSGNVYLGYVLGDSFGAEIKSVRTHELKTLINYKDSDPFIVPVRGALDSIASAKVFRDYVYDNKLYGDRNRDESSLETIVARYKKYIDYLLENPQFFIAPFHEFTKDHGPVIDKIVKFYPDVQFLRKKHPSTKKDILLSASLTKNAFHKELGNFPREEVYKKYTIKDLLLAQHGHDIHYMQNKINSLYQRYDNYKGF
jgi:hypothetical protein